MSEWEETVRFADDFILACTKIIYKLSVGINKFMQVQKVLLRVSLMAVLEFLS